MTCNEFTNNNNTISLWLGPLNDMFDRGGFIKVEMSDLMINA